jgi:hypothetical protein
MKIKQNGYTSRVNRGEIHEKTIDVSHSVRMAYFFLDSLLCT